MNANNNTEITAIGTTTSINNNHRHRTNCIHSFMPTKLLKKYKNLFYSIRKI